MERYARYQAVQALVAEGISLSEIALRGGVHRVTVQRFAQATTFPERASHQSQSSILVPFLSYLHQRFLEGCTNSPQLWCELCQSFRKMVRKKQAEQLQEWLTSLKESWSNGQTEGQNTSLKLLKR